MKKILITLSVITFSLYTLFAANKPNILLKGHLGENLPANIILKVDETDISGGSVNMGDDYDLTSNTTSKAKPVYAYARTRMDSFSTFNIKVSTEGFKRTNSEFVLNGVGLTMYTQAISNNNGIINKVFDLTESSSEGIINGTSNVFEKTIFTTDSQSHPAYFKYEVSPGAVENAKNFGLWFAWNTYEKASAGSYTATVVFDISLEN